VDLERRAVLVVFEAREDADGVPLDAIEMMVRRCPRWKPVTMMGGSWRFIGGSGCYGRDRA
jgi:hypothetical protein